MKTLMSFSVLAILATVSSVAHADFGSANRGPFRPGPNPPVYNWRCAQAQQRLNQAYQSMAQAQAMANNSVAICGQSASCYQQIQQAVLMNQQNVANAQAEVRWACHP